MHVLGLYFGLPAGSIWGNLLASAIWAIPAWWRLRTRMNRHHAERLAQADRHHRELKAHVTATVTAAARTHKRLAPRTGGTPGETA